MLVPAPAYMTMPARYRATCDPKPSAAPPLTFDISSVPDTGISSPVVLPPTTTPAGPNRPAIPRAFDTQDLMNQMMMSSMLSASAGGINMEIPSFSGGDPSDFRCFEAMVEGCVKPLIHLSELQKYFIIRSKLGGQAKKDVLGLEHDDKSFTKAMMKLKRLYGDVTVLIRRKIEEITSWPKLRAFDSKGQVEFTSVVSTLVTQLQSAPEGRSELQANSTACVLYSRLSPTHHTAFLRHMEKREITNFSLVDINEWLQEVAAVARKKMQLEESQSNGHPTTGRDKRSKGASAFHMQTGNSNSKTGVDSSNSTHLSSFKGKRKFVRKCPRCQEDHWLSGCSEFKALASEERMRWIKEGHRCWKCARQHKQGQECDLRKTCMECNQLHLTVLHNLLTQPGYGVYYTQFNPNLSAFYGDGNPWHSREVSMKVSTHNPLWP